MRMIHMSLDVRGALKNRSFDGFKRDDGTPASPQEAFDFLCDQLAMGRKVIPMGKECEGFDYSGGGCPGHTE